MPAGISAGIPENAVFPLLLFSLPQTDRKVPPDRTHPPSPYRLDFRLFLNNPPACPDMRRCPWSHTVPLPPRAAHPDPRYPHSRRYCSLLDFQIR